MKPKTMCLRIWILFFEVNKEDTNPAESKSAGETVAALLGLQSEKKSCVQLSGILAENAGVKSGNEKRNLSS